ncbi:MAG: hypothetical protein AB7I79_18565 [Rhizobiaceae bacterium]
MNPLAIQDVYQPYYAGRETDEARKLSKDRKPVFTPEERRSMIRRAPRRGERIPSAESGKPS